MCRWLSHEIAVPYLNQCQKLLPEKKNYFLDAKDKKVLNYNKNMKAKSCWNCNQ